MTADYRFLLDQNFPSPPFDARLVDGRVEYVHIHDYDESLTQGQTPDWLIYLRAEEGGFTGVVTRLDNQGTGIFYLPKPQLTSRSVTRAGSLMGAYAKSQQRSQQELRDEAYEISIISSVVVVNDVSPTEVGHAAVVRLMGPDPRGGREPTWLAGVEADSGRVVVGVGEPAGPDGHVTC